MNKKTTLRAWDGKRMLYRDLFDRNWYDSEKGGGGCVRGIHPNDIYELVIMFSTGIILLNNETLFEGDLFKSTQSDIIYRVYREKGGFVINTNVERWQKDIKKDFIFPSQPLADEQTISWVETTCTKIGNIFENIEIIDNLVC